MRTTLVVGAALVLAGAALAAGAGAERADDPPAAADVLATLAAGRSTVGAPSVPVTFAGTGLVDRRAWADADADGTADRVEEALCGSATCAVPWADLDGDGVSDAAEVLVCGSARCVDPGVDHDRDRIPDFVGALLCGDGGCPAGVLRGDVDSDGVENWVEALIAEDATGATGHEDLDGDGVADAAALLACLAIGPLAVTGVEVWWLLAVALAAGGAGLVLRGRRSTRRGAAGEVEA